MADDPIEVLERWEDHGAVWRVAALSDRHVSIDLCTCSGEPVDRLESDDSRVIQLARERAAAESG